jgi:ATP-binding cassette subfamily F protein uup
VLDALDVGVSFGDRDVLEHVTWRLGPGDRVALVGANGAGKTTLIRVLSGDVEPTSGELERGQTVRLAHLSQDTVELPGELRVLEALEEVRQTTRTSDGVEQSAGQLVERFGFRGGKAHTRVRELSGGERRRLQLMRLLMEEPNVLILDEPTNDLDIDTLTSLEDLLDGWPGTLIVVSHDRYFVERVCDDVYAIEPGGGGIRHLPGGIEQYVSERHAAEQAESAAAVPAAPASAPDASSGPTNAELRQARKDLVRIERQLERSTERETGLEAAMAEAASDHARLAELEVERRAAVDERELLEAQWLDVSELLGD